MQGQPEDRNRQQDQFDRQAPELVEDPDDDFVRDENAGLLKIRADLNEYLPRRRLVSVWMHKLSSLNIQRR